MKIELRIGLEIAFHHSALILVDNPLAIFDMFYLFYN